MCLDCGCLQPANNHGDARHIVQKQLEAAADANDNTPVESAKQIVRTLKHAETLPDSSDPVDVFAQHASRPLISFDFDNVLCHKTEALITVLNQEDGKMREFADMDEVEERDVWPELKSVIKAFHKNPSSYLNLVPYPDAVAFAQALSKAGFTIVIATRRKPKVKDVSDTWLKNVEFPPVEQMFDGKTSKTDVCDFAKQQGMNVLHFDDDPRNKELMEDYYKGCRVLLPERPYTKGDTDVFQSWRDVLTLLGIDQTLNLTQEVAF